MRALRKMVLLLSLLLIVMLFSGCQNEVENLSKKSYMLGTEVEINLWTEDIDKGKRILEECFDRINEIEERMSMNIANSDISLINKNSGENPVAVHGDTAYVINKSLEYARMSHGAFDPTIGKLVKLWGIGTVNAKIPNETEIIDALKYVDYDFLKIIDTNKCIIEKKGSSIDLGGIAKGYAADEVYSILKNNGIEHALINLGGNILTLGKKIDDTNWRVGVQNPYETTGTQMAIVEVSDKAVVTSGNYERYFIKDDVRYHHIIDSKTGYPAQKGIISSTIISNKSIDADALSTAVYNLGVDEGLSLIEKLENVETIIITEENEVYLSSGLDKITTIVDNNFNLIE